MKSLLPVTPPGIVARWVDRAFFAACLFSLYHFLKYLHPVHCYSVADGLYCLYLYERERYTVEENRLKSHLRQLKADLGPMSWKDRMDHLWTYYKWVAGLFILLLVFLNIGVTAMISATMAMDNSSGVSPPRSRPMGEWTCSRSAREKPAASNFS